MKNGKTEKLLSMLRDDSPYLFALAGTILFFCHQYALLYLATALCLFFEFVICKANPDSDTLCVIPAAICFVTGLVFRLNIFSMIAIGICLYFDFVFLLIVVGILIGKSASK